MLSILRKENSKRFSYSIISTTLSKDKKSATIKVKVKYRSLYEAAYRAMADTVMDLIKYYFKYGKEPSSTKSLGWLLNNLKKEAKKHPGNSPCSGSNHFFMSPYGSGTCGGVHS